MQYFSTKYGLVTDNDPVSENGQLFLATYILLLSGKVNPDEISRLNDIMHLQLKESSADFRNPGLVRRNPFLTERIQSHDNLAGIFSWAFITNHPIRFEIWKYLLKHLGTYDTSNGKSKQLSRFLPFNPANFFIWGKCVGSKIYMLFLPFYIINLILTCNSPVNNTSGKILTWVELYPHKNTGICKYLFRYYEKMMIKQYGLPYFYYIMKIYHGVNSNEFPLNKILGIVK